MRRPYHFCAGWLFALGAGLACHTVAWSAGPEDIEHLTLVGRVFVEPVDARRVLVAVTTRMDGVSQHLFLYTASQSLSVNPRMRDVQATVYYETTGGLRITPAASDAQTLEFVVSPAFDSRRTDGSVIGFKQTLALKHYVANPRLRLEDLNAVHKTRDCDLAPQTCVEVAGQFLPFAG